MILDKTSWLLNSDRVKGLRVETYLELNIKIKLN
jgi:hypothetical protein